MRICLILVFLFFASCGGRKAEVADSTAVVEIDPNSKDIIRMSDFVESVEYIRA